MRQNYSYEEARHAELSSANAPQSQKRKSEVQRTPSPARAPSPIRGPSPPRVTPYRSLGISTGRCLMAQSSLGRYSGASALRSMFNPAYAQPQPTQSSSSAGPTLPSFASPYTVAQNRGLGVPVPCPEFRSSQMFSIPSPMCSAPEGLLPSQQEQQPSTPSPFSSAPASLLSREEDIPVDPQLEAQSTSLVDSLSASVGRVAAGVRGAIPRFFARGQHSDDTPAAAAARRARLNVQREHRRRERGGEEVSETPSLARFMLPPSVPGFL